MGRLSVVTRGVRCVGALGMGEARKPRRVDVGHGMGVFLDLSET